jgi:hypothetical protein
MMQRFQFSTATLMKVTIGLAIACFVVRLGVQLSAGIPLNLRNVFYIVAASTFVLAPFAVVGAMFDRAGAGLLWGLALIIVAAALLHGI